MEFNKVRPSNLSCTEKFEGSLDTVDHGLCCHRKLFLHDYIPLWLITYYYVRLCQVLNIGIKPL